MYWEEMEIARAEDEDREEWQVENSAKVMGIEIMGG